MLRLCRNTLSFESVAPQQGAVGPVFLFGDTPESSPAALPLGACFEHAQQLGDQNRLHLRLLLAQYQPYQLLSTAPNTATKPGQRASPTAEGANSTPADSTPVKAAVVLQQEQQQRQPLVETEYDVTQDSQSAAAVPAEAAAVVNRQDYQGLDARDVADAQEQRQAVTSNTAVPADAAVHLAATAWPSMIPETCLEHTASEAVVAVVVPASTEQLLADHDTAILRGADAAATKAPATRSPADSNATQQDSKPNCDSTTMPPQHHHQQLQRTSALEPELLGGLDAVPAAAKQNNAVRPSVKAQQVQQTEHVTSTETPAATSAADPVQCRRDTVAADNSSEVTRITEQQHSKQALAVDGMVVTTTTTTAAAAAAATARSRKYTGPQLQLQPAAAAAAAVADQQQQDITRQQRQPLAPISAANAAKTTPHAAAPGKGRHKATVMDQLAALPVRRPQAPLPPLAAAAAASAGIADVPLLAQQTSMMGQQQQQQQLCPQQDQQQQWPVQPWHHHQQPQQQRQQYPCTHQQHQDVHPQQQQHAMQAPAGGFRISGLKPPVQPRQQQRQQQYASAQSAAAAAPARPIQLLAPRNEAAGPTAAAKAYRQKTTFKCPRPIKTASAVGRSAAAAAAAAAPGSYGEHENKAHRSALPALKPVPSAAVSVQDRPNETADTPSRDSELQDPIYQRFMAATAAAAGSDAGAISFVTCGGKKLEMSEATKARTAALLAEADAAAAAEEAAAAKKEAAAAAEAGVAIEPGEHAEDLAEAAAREAELQDPIYQRFMAATAAAAGGDAGAISFVTCGGKKLEMSEAAKARTAALLAETDAAAAGVEAAVLLKAEHHSHDLAEVAAESRTDCNNCGIGQQQQQRWLGGSRVSGDFNPPRPAAPRSAAAAAVVPRHSEDVIQPQQQQRHWQLPACPPWQQQQQHTMQGYQSLHAAAADTAGLTAAAAAAGVSSTPQGGWSGSSQELASLDRLMEAADRYAAEHTAAAAMATAAGSRQNNSTTEHTDAGNVAATAAEVCAVTTAVSSEVDEAVAGSIAAAAAGAHDICPPLEPPFSKLGIRAAAAAAIAAAGGSEESQQKSLYHSPTAAAIDAQQRMPEHVVDAAAANLRTTAAAGAAGVASSSEEDGKDLPLDPPGDVAAALAAASAVGVSAFANAACLAANNQAATGSMPCAQAADQLATIASCQYRCAKSGADGSTSSGSVGSGSTGSTSCAGGSTLERQVSDASGGVVSETLTPGQDQTQQQQQQLKECQPHCKQQLQQQGEKQQQEQQESCRSSVAGTVNHQQPQPQQQQWQVDEVDRGMDTEAAMHAQHHGDCVLTTPGGESHQAVQQQQQQQQADQLRQPSPTPTAAAAAIPSRKRNACKIWPVQVPAAAAAAGLAVPSPYPGLLWASGKGLLLSRSAAARGQAVLERLQHMGLLPSTAAAAAGAAEGSKSALVAAATADLAADLLIGADGTVDLVLCDSRGGAEQLPAAALTGAAAAAAAAEVMRTGGAGSRSGSKRCHGDTAGAGVAAAGAVQQLSCRGLTYADVVDGSGALGIAVEAAAAAAAVIDDVPPPAKRLLYSSDRGRQPGSEHKSDSAAAATAAAAANGEVEDAAVVAATPTTAPATNMAAAAAKQVLHSPSPSPARGRKLSFSAASFVTPLPTATGRSRDRAAALACIPETPAAAAGAASIEVPAAGAVAGAACVVPETPLPTVYHHQQQQQQQQQANGQSVSINASHIAVRCKLEAGRKDTEAMFDASELDQQQQLEPRASDQHAGDTIMLEDYFLDQQHVTAAGDTLQLEGKEHEQQQQQQHNVADQRMVDTIVLEDQQHDVAAGDTLQIEALGHEQQQQQQDAPDQHVGDTIMLEDDLPGQQTDADAAGDTLELEGLGHKQQQQQQHNVPDQHVADTIMLVDDLSDQQTDPAAASDTLQLAALVQQQQQQKHNAPYQHVGDTIMLEDDLPGQQTDAAAASDTLQLEGSAHEQQQHHQQQQQHNVPDQHVGDTIMLHDDLPGQQTDPAAAGDTLQIEGLAHEQQHHQQQQQVAPDQRVGDRVVLQDDLAGQQTDAAAAGDTLQLEDLHHEQQQQQQPAVSYVLEAPQGTCGVRPSHVAMATAAAEFSSAPAAAACGPSLQTAGGRRVPVDAAQLAAFHQQVGWIPQQQQQIDHQQQSHSYGAVVDRAVCRASKRCCASTENLHSGHSMQQQQHRHQLQQQQQHLGPPASATLSTGSAKHVPVAPDSLAAFKHRLGDAAAAAQPQQQQRLQQQHQQLGPPASATLSTGSAKHVPVAPESLAAFKHRIGDAAAAEPQQQQQRQLQQQQQQLGPPASATLSTGSGKHVPIAPESLAAFKHRMGVAAAAQPQQQQYEAVPMAAAAPHVAAHAAAGATTHNTTPTTAAAARPGLSFTGLSTGSGKEVPVDTAKMLAFAQTMGVTEMQLNKEHLELQQQQQVQPLVTLPAAITNAAPAAAPIYAGLSTGSGKKVPVDAAMVAAFRQKVGFKELQQQQQAMPATPATAAAAATAADAAYPLTGTGKNNIVDPAKLAAFAQTVSLSEQQQKQSSVLQVSAAAPAAVGCAGLSTAGGRIVGVNPAAAAAFKQMLLDTDDDDQQQQQRQDMILDQLPPNAAGPTAAITPHSRVVHQSASAGKPPAGPGAAAAAGSTPACAAAAAAAAGPMSAPRITSRKRQLPPQQQQQQRTGGKKAFKLPMKPGSSVVGTPAAVARTPGQQQQQQAERNKVSAASAAIAKQPKVRGLPIAEYFALARAMKTPPTAAAAEASVSSAAAADSWQQWLPLDLPVTLEQAAAYSFAAADPTAQQHQQQNIQPASEISFRSAAAVDTGNAPPAAAAAAMAAAAAFSWPQAREQLIAWGANPEKATSAWVSNHYMLIVWKLAAYDRKLLATESSSSTAAAAAAAGSVLRHPGIPRCLTVGNVMQQLQKRYTAELVEGQRSVLKKICEQDLPSGVPIVLVVTAIRTSGSSSSKIQQQQGGDGSSVSAAVAGDVCGIQLSDGWYCLNGIIDAPLIELIVQGKIQVGSKLRVVGGVLVSDRPADPLEAAKWAQLRICYNGTSPAAWDERLGPVASGQTLRALSRVHPAGGLVPRLLLLVQRCYPVLYYCRSSKKCYTRKQYDAAEKKAERQRDQALQAAAAAVQQAEVDQCKIWAASKTAAAVEKAYATAVLGSCDDSIGKTVTPGQLQLLRSQRESDMEQQRQQHMQRLIAQGSTAAAAAGSSSSNLSLEPLVPIQRLRVSGVVPQGLGPVWGFSQAMIRVWRAGDLMQGLDEGLVVIATGLQAGVDGRNSLCDIEWQGGTRMLELSSGKSTSWQVLGPASRLSTQYDMEPWHSRSKVKLDTLTESDLKTEFDFVGVLLYAGEVFTGHRECHQWIFLAGDVSSCSSVSPPAETAAAGVTTPAQQRDKQQQAAGNAAGSAETSPPAAAAAVVPSVLAVKLIGTETSVDWLEPTPADSHGSHGRAQQQQQVGSAVNTPAAAAASIAATSNSTTSRPSTRRFIAARQQQQAQVRETSISCSSLILTTRDVSNNMWVATAHDTAVVAVLSGAAVGSRAAKPVQELLSWAQKEQKLLAQLKQKVRLLVQG